MKNLKYNLFLKTGIIVLIALLLLIPAAMIQGLIYERENTQREAINEVSSTWAYQQTLSGPILTIPHIEYIKQASDTSKVISIKQYLHFLPDELSVNGSVTPEKRKRGIYEVVVYNSALHFKGYFNALNLKDLNINPKNLLLDQAYISVGISDLRGIEKQIILNWNDASLAFEPGTGNKEVVTSGINTPVSIDTKQKNTFAFQIQLKGSEQLFFSPLGKETDVMLNSVWNNPSFQGAFLPDSRDVSEKGFQAHWNVLNVNRNFPQQWKGSLYSISDASFGVSLRLPVDNYQKSMRTAKYAILFIALTFMVFFFVEILNKQFIHPVQYILVGFALIIFFTLLLSFSEYISFNLAYILAAILTIALVTAYIKAILKSNALTLLIFGILLLLYGFIFVIIQLQDFALLIGSIGLFVILGFVMYFSRKIDWYAINLNEEKQS